ncbi:rab-GTPase-TBC domain-containing protein [Radiomyces spectabilis]|uniref:rab-GTPase-TBC domain-containing protein n=1 Tax=Radiomyces spectabilis TaxID=64574 RepID=UPI0022201EBD|nr:rab-GTPase-TBC domain-containing protein [Radiomyces spectabilis]KAI8379165.1 rab-GTPase-TBC domain-containing protein [Radiomyces spectabilis]
MRYQRTLGNLPSHDDIHSASASPKNTETMTSQQKIEEILKRQHQNDEEGAENSLYELRLEILRGGCPPKLRGSAWKLLLRLTNVSSSCYVNLVHRGPSPMDSKIRNDTFRTMTTDASFIEHVSEDMLIRVLNAFVWISRQERVGDTSEELQLRSLFRSWYSTPGELTYVQGMNVLVAPFLTTMTEMEAFFAFSTFIWKWCPVYVEHTLRGVHCGLRLLDLCLQSLDPMLYGYLRGRGLTANMYACASVLTFSACTPPLSELLQLWDLMLACGTHLNILFIIAQLALIRKELMDCSSPMKILRKLPNLQAQPIIKIALASCKKLPPDLYDKLVRHAYDETVSDCLGVQLAAGSSSMQDDCTTVPPYIAEAAGYTTNDCA